MIVAKKIVELFSHQRSVNKFIKSLDNELQSRTVMVFLACAIRESECKSTFTFYTMPQVIDLCDKMDWLSSKESQYPVYREHKKLLELGFVDRLTEKSLYKGQQFCITLTGRLQVRRLYNYLIRDLYSPL